MIRSNAALPVQTEAVRPVPARSTGRMQAVAWSAFGFVAGAVFWHLVGFWSLVSLAVLGSGDKRAPVAAGANSDLRAPVLETGSLGNAVKPRCVVLVLDRLGGETREAPCPVTTFHHRNAGVGIRRDRQPPRAGRRDDSDWAARLDTNGPPRP